MKMKNPKENPKKERKLWLSFEQKPFEWKVALEHIMFQRKAIILRIIKDTMEAGFIKLSDENVTPKLKRYILY